MKPLRHIIIDPDKRLVEARTATLNLDYLKNIVKGWIEAAPRSVDGVNCTLYINEEGRLNRMTPFLLHCNYGPEEFCGPMVIVGPPDEDGEETETTVTLDQVNKSLCWLAKPEAILASTSAPRLARVYTDSEYFHVAVWCPALFEWDETVNWIEAEKEKKIEVFHLSGAELGLLPQSMKQLYEPGKILSTEEFTIARTYIERAIELVREKTKYNITEAAGIEHG